MQNKNKGFTLVELIVVIVILAILIGVTIGGIYVWVGKAKENTDKHTAATMQDLLQSVYVDDEFYAELSSYETIIWYFTWKDAVSVDTIKSTWYYQNAQPPQKAIYNYLVKILPDGLPESKTGKGFICIVTYSINGHTEIGRQNSEGENVTIKVYDYADAPATLTIFGPTGTTKERLFDSYNMKYDGYDFGTSWIMTPKH